MPFFQNVYNTDFIGTMVLGDKNLLLNFNIPGNKNNVHDMVCFNLEPYDVSTNNILTINYSNDGKNFAALAIDVSTSAANTSAAKAREIVTALNNNTRFSSYFTASVANNNLVRIQIVNQLRELIIKTYISNTSAESILKFNAHAGVAEIPTYFARHTIANANNYTDSDSLIIQLDGTDAAIDRPIIRNYLNNQFWTNSSLQTDYQLFQGRTGIFNFQKITVDGSDRVTQIIKYPAGAVAGDFSNMIKCSYSGGNIDPSQITVSPYTLTSLDLVFPPVGGGGGGGGVTVDFLANGRLRVGGNVTTSAYYIYVHTSTGGLRLGGAGVSMRVYVGTGGLRVGGAADASTGLPTLAYVSPADNVALPGGVDVFTPAVFNITVDPSAPVIAGFTKQSIPDSSVAITGLNISSSDTTFLAFGQTASNNGTYLTTTQLEITTGRAVATLSSSIPSSSMYLVWPKNSVGYGTPVAINQTTALWLQCLTTAFQWGTTTDTVYVGGQNLSSGGGSPTCLVYLIKTDGTGGQYITPTSVNPYLVTFVLPSVATGDYYVWLHNTHGGIYGWSKVPPVKEYTQASLRADTLANLLMDYSRYVYPMPDPTGGDDTANIVAAIADVNTHGGNNTTTAGTVLFKSNVTYLISNKISGVGGGGSGILFKGTNTTIQSMSTFNKDKMFNCDFSLSAFDGVNLVVGAGVTNWVGASTTLGNAVSSGISFSNMTIDTHLLSTIMTGGSADIGAAPFGGGVNITRHSGVPVGVVFKNCIFTCGIGTFSRGHNLLVEGCTFNGGKDVNSGGPVTTWFGNRIIMRNCTVQQIDPAAYPNEGRLFFGSASAQDCLYIGDNTSVNMQNSSGDLNKGEQIAFEQNLGAFSGLAVSWTSNTVVLSSASNGWVGLQLYISAGRGVTQWAMINSVNTTTKVLTLDRNWIIQPDVTSRINVVGCVSRAFMYNNNLNVNDPHYTAATGVQLFGGAIECIYDSNTVAGTGYAVASQTSSFNGLSVPTMFNIFQNGTFTGIKIYGIRALSGPNAPNGETAVSIGNIYRNNNITMTTVANTSGLTECNIGFTGDSSRTDLITFEHNTITNSTTGLYIFNTSTSSPTTTLILYKNNFSLGSATFSGSKAIGHASGQGAPTTGVPTNFTVIQSPSSGQYTGFQA